MKKTSPMQRGNFVTNVLEILDFEPYYDFTPKFKISWNFCCKCITIGIWIKGYELKFRKNKEKKKKKKSKEQNKIKEENNRD